MTEKLTIQDIDVDQAYLVITDVVVATAKKFGTHRYIERDSSLVAEGIAIPLSLEL